LSSKSFDKILIRILISNTGLPSAKIGSWTNRITRLLESHPKLFDWILSPTDTPGGQFVYCRKEKAKPGILAKILRKSPALLVASQYFKALERLTKDQTEIQLLVMDDLALLEAIADWKTRQKSTVRLDFSFHGHSFILPEAWGKQVNKVYFLTQLGYQETRRRNDVFAPIVEIIGNGCDSNLFFPLSPADKLQSKLSLGYRDQDKILLWVSNPRPKKGLDLFLQLGKRLQAIYPDLKILLIGAPKDLQLADDSWKSLGKIPNAELPNYLQIGDFYCFTSLWKEGFGLSLIEAAKCGNQVIVSSTGGIPEVVQNLPNSYLVESPNIIESWVEAFDQAWDSRSDFAPERDSLSNFQNLDDWNRRLLNALES